MTTPSAIKALVNKLRHHIGRVTPDTAGHSAKLQGGSAQEIVSTLRSVVIEAAARDQALIICSSLLSGLSREEEAENALEALHAEEAFLDLRNTAHAAHGALLHELLEYIIDLFEAKQSIEPQLLTLPNHYEHTQGLRNVDEMKLGELRTELKIRRHDAGRWMAKEAAWIEKNALVEAQLSKAQQQCRDYHDLCRASETKCASLQHKLNEIAGKREEAHDRRKEKLQELLQEADRGVRRVYGDDALKSQNSKLPFPTQSATAIYDKPVPAPAPTIAPSSAPAPSPAAPPALVAVLPPAPAPTIAPPLAPVPKSGEMNVHALQESLTQQMKRMKLKMEAAAAKVNPAQNLGASIGTPKTDMVGLSATNSYYAPALSQILNPAAALGADGTRAA